MQVDRQCRLKWFGHVKRIEKGDWVPDCKGVDKMLFMGIVKCVQIRKNGLTEDADDDDIQCNIHAIQYNVT